MQETPFGVQKTLRRVHLSVYCCIYRVTAECSGTTLESVESRPSDLAQRHRVSVGTGDTIIA